jgi:molybdopterin biosynthesis enzyme MoaB
MSLGLSVYRQISYKTKKMAKVEIVAAVLTISDSASRGEREDRSGPAVVVELRSWAAALPQLKSFQMIAT